MQQKYAPLFSTLSRHRLNDVFKMDYSSRKQGSLALPCGHGNAPSASAKCMKLHFYNWLRSPSRTSPWPFILWVITDYLATRIYLHNLQHTDSKELLTKALNKCVCVCFFFFYYAKSVYFSVYFNSLPIALLTSQRMKRTMS